MSIDALCYCYVYYNQGERDGVWFRKNVQIVGAIMKLIFTVKRVGTGLRSCCCFSHTALNLVGARVYMVKPNNKVANVGSV